MRFKSIVLLGVIIILLFSSYSLIKKEETFNEVAWGYDPTGYLLSAKMLRESPRISPKVDISSLQSKELIKLFQARSLPESTWVSSVGPPSSQYHSKSQVVGIQYPPGVGFIFSLFEDGSAAKRMNQITILLISFLGLGLILRAAYLNSPACMGMVALSHLFSIDIIRRMGDTSYSINVSLIPTVFGMVSSVYLFLYDHRLSKRAQIFAYSLLGATFGVCTSVRITTAFILFSLLIWLLKKDFRNKAAFAFWYVLTGALPILAYQRAVTGDFFKSTYPSFDKTLPSIFVLRDTIPFYFGQGSGAVYNWILISLCIGLIGLIYSNTKKSAFLNQGERFQFWIGSASIFLLPVMYFLTHAVHVHYYLINSLLSVSWVITVASIELYAHQPGQVNSYDQGVSSQIGSAISKDQLRRGFMTPVRALKWLPLLVALGWSVKTNCLNSAPFFLPGASVPEIKVLPEVLRDEKSWVIADTKIGTLWYYFNRFSFFAKGASKEARQVYYSFLRSQQSPIYFIQDGEGAVEIRQELEEIGAVFKERGKVLDAPYFQVEFMPQV